VTTTSDEIRLVVPAQPEYGRLARVTVAGLALRLGFSHTEVEDLRLAVDESLILLLDGSGHDGDVEVVYRLLDEAIELEVTADVGRRVPPPSDGAIDRFQRMVADLVDVAVADPMKRTVRFRKARR